MDSIDVESQRVARIFLDRIKPQFDVAGAIVFGSRARRTHQPDSDLDVAVLLRGNAEKFLSVKLQMADTAFDILLETGIRIQPLPIWEDEWAHPECYSNPSLLQNIVEEGVSL